MKLSTSNILSVTVLIKSGITYEIHVCMKSRLVSDSRTYVNYGENGKTIVADYPFEKLPKSVQTFITRASTTGRWTLGTVEDDFVSITYRAA